MRELALTIQGTDKTISIPNALPKPTPGGAIQDQTLGGLLTGFLPIAIYLAGFLMIFWMSWGIFQYIFAGGNKEALGKARSRITYSIVGFLLVVIAFSVYQYTQTIFNANPDFKSFNKETKITVPK